MKLLQIKAAYNEKSAYEIFYRKEFDYSTFLEKFNYTAPKIIPFQDTSNDSYFKIGTISKETLENYTAINMQEVLGTLKNKPWLPLQQIKEEIANCLFVKYGSVSDHDFKYDKGLYGWMNIMKFSCAQVRTDLWIFGMAFYRTRFRLKQVYLKRQNKYWATTGRAIVTRDAQKIIDDFIVQFCDSADTALDIEIESERTTPRPKERNVKEKGPFAKLTDIAYKEIRALVGPMLNHTSSSDSRVHTYNTLAVPIRSRVMITQPDKVGLLLEAISIELHDDAMVELDNCEKTTCRYEKMTNDSYNYNAKTETHNYSKERAIIHKMKPTETLIFYQTSKPYFTFDTMKRKTAHGIIDLKQQLDENAQKNWHDLVHQQFALAAHTQYQAFLPEIELGGGGTELNVEDFDVLLETE
ncbi:hypothetical protein WR25_11794 [Diploscapter pachys]|uniref:Uncharacterized protein n=1 Tax=Diploscapter pachys TaxID=2018661 RepID=A0A2A2J9A3_9BILA|nr:hypothetical protein WR25_11794 [Diploscapter pachys]